VRLSHIILIEFLADIDSVKMNNLDLFDLLPQNFLPLLLRYKRENRVFLEEIAIIKERIFEIDDYFDPTTLTIKSIGLPSKSKKSELSDEDILQKLKSARQNTLEVLKKQNGTIPESLRIDIDLEEPSVITDQPSTPKYGKVQKPVFYNLFGNFARINQDVIRKFNINLSNLVNSSRDKMASIDLEDLFYLVSIFKMIGISSQLETSRVVGVLQNYVSGKIFSTAKYHKPNPINTFYGIAILSELDLLNQSEFIDMLEIEMFLEGEMRNFFPEKLLLNFYTILSLKLLERNGTSLTNKNGLYASLLNLNLLSIERFNPSLDIFCHLTSLKLLNDQADLNKFTIPYMREILKRIDQSNGSVNNCITDTARVLLSLNLLDPMDQEMYLKKQLTNFLITGIKYFDDEELENELNWGNDSIAYKLELRMLYWALVAISQNLKLA